MTARLWIVAVGLAAALGTSAGAQPSAQTAQPAPKSTNMQSTDAQTAFFDALMREYYDLSVAELKGRAASVDAAAFERKSYALFRAFASSHGANPDHLQEHLKAIPRQIVQIVKDDPKVLDNIHNFSDALIGPPPPP